MSTRQHVEQAPDIDTGSAQVIDTVLRVIPDAAIVADATGTIVAANTGAESMFGYRPGALTGIAVEVLVPDRHRDNHARLRAQYVAHPAFASDGQGP